MVSQRRIVPAVPGVGVDRRRPVISGDGDTGPRQIVMAQHRVATVLRVALIKVGVHGERPGIGSREGICVCGAYAYSDNSQYNGCIFCNHFILLLLLLLLFRVRQVPEM